jgi:hypothetical protein
MGVGHIEGERERHPKHVRREEWSRPRHRVAGADEEPGVTAGCDAVPAKAAAPGRSFIADISTPALILAATGLLALGLVARLVSDTEQAPPARAAAAVEAPQATRSPGTPTPTIDPRGEMSRELVVVPESVCHQFVQTRQQLPSLTISVENSCT